MYDRWAEPLESGIAQVLADDLGAHVGSERIAVFPWRGGVARVLDYQVAVVVLRFEGWPGRRGDPGRALAALIGKDGNGARAEAFHPPASLSPNRATSRSYKG